MRPEDDQQTQRPVERTGMRLSRRGLLGGAAGAAGVVAAGTLVGCSSGSDATSPNPAHDTVGFLGAHQAGIATPAQDRLAFAAFDITSTDRAEVIALLKTWSAAAAALTSGKPVPGVSDDPAAPPADTGDALGLGPHKLTVTVGFGPAMFDERFGLAGRRPAALRPLPALPGDELAAEKSGGDLCIQACSNDPGVAFHAIRNLARLGRGTVAMRWSQLGFGRTSSTTSNQSTPRNLMGFKDGTRNVHGDDDATMNRDVWAPGSGSTGWMQGGSYLVARRIRMLIESWDRDNLADQQNVFGRSKVSGAPLTGAHEFDTPNLAATDTSTGEPTIATDAHIRLASRETNGGIQMLRRGYSYTDGIDPGSGELDAGLFFICFVRDPGQFITLQRKLGSRDALNEYIKHTGSALFACPGGLRDSSDWWGRTLFT